MVTYLFYNTGTEGQRQMEDLAKRLESTDVIHELIDADSARGTSLCEVLDIMARPAVAVVRDDGSPIEIWQGTEQIPPPTEISYFSHM